MHKLKYKQLLTLPKGKYHDGKGLYVSISSQGRGKWSYRYRLDHKSREMGLSKKNAKELKLYFFNFV